MDGLLRLAARSFRQLRELEPNAEADADLTPVAGAPHLQGLRLRVGIVPMRIRLSPGAPWPALQACRFDRNDSDHTKTCTLDIDWARLVGLTELDLDPECCRWSPSTPLRLAPCSRQLRTLGLPRHGVDSLSHGLDCLERLESLTCVGFSSLDDLAMTASVSILRRLQLYIPSRADLQLERGLLREFSRLAEVDMHLGWQPFLMEDMNCAIALQRHLPPRCRLAFKAAR